MPTFTSSATKPHSRRNYILLLVVLSFLLSALQDTQLNQPGRWVPQLQADSYSDDYSSLDDLDSVDHHLPGKSDTRDQRKTGVDKGTTPNSTTDAMRLSAGSRSIHSAVSVPGNQSKQGQRFDNKTRSSASQQTPPAPSQSQGQVGDRSEVGRQNQSHQESPRDSSQVLALDDSDSFSACVLIMDENPRLPEWIAYHYYAMPLRYLVVAVDPYSVSSPKSILDRWKDRMTIHQWTDSDFTNVSLVRPNHPNATIQKRLVLGKYLRRQEYFFKSCALFLKQQNRSWTTFHDVDEFISPNERVLGRDFSDSLASEPGFVLKTLKQLRSQTFPIENNASLAWSQHFDQSHCVTLPRSMFSSKESEPEEISRGVPKFLDPLRFDTLRWRYRTHAHTGEGPIDLVKSFIDVTRLQPKDFKGSVNPHRPLKFVCPEPTWMHYNSMPMGFHHYIGSWEAYNYRLQDARQGGARNYNAWKKYALKNTMDASDEGRPWIDGFVKLVGEDEAKRLLGDAGFPASLNVSDPAVV